MLGVGVGGVRGSGHGSVITVKVFARVYKGLGARGEGWEFGVGGGGGRGLESGGWGSGVGEWGVGGRG